MSAAVDDNCSQATEMGLETLEFENCTANELDPLRLSIIPIFFASLTGNVCTLLLLAAFKKHKVADVAVGGLAVTDLIATLGPVAMSIYSYLTLNDFVADSATCVAFSTVAMFTRSSSCMIVTATTIDRFLAICTPFFYKKHATPRAYALIVLACWLLSVAIAVVPVSDPDSMVASHGGFCLFDFTSSYAIAVAVIALVQFVVVLVCFFFSSLSLLLKSRLRLKRSALRLSNKYEQSKLSLQKSQGTIVSRIGQFRRSTVTSLFQVRVEAEFLLMFSAVVALFYFSWLPIVVMIIYAQSKGSQDMLDTGIFWAIRFTVLSTALNPMLYGLLARRYRGAYGYVVRYLFGACCSCVTVPERNPFTEKVRAVNRSASSANGDSSNSSEKKSEHRFSPLTSESEPESPLAVSIQNSSLGLLSSALEGCAEVGNIETAQTLASFTYSSHVQA